MNRFDEMRAAMREAKATLQAADSVAQELAEMLNGRLRKCRPLVLRQLKTLLRDFNAHTGNWK